MISGLRFEALSCTREKGLFFIVLQADYNEENFFMKTGVSAQP